MLIMKYTRLMAALILLLLNLAATAQPGNGALALPSANNTFLGKTPTGADIGLDRYTGTAQVSIPVCNLSAKASSIPISLNYLDGRGVRVQEYATQVGLGWQLNAGGSISRVVRGFPDEEPNGYLGVGPGGGAPNWGTVVANASATGNFWTAISPSNY